MIFINYKHTVYGKYSYFVKSVWPIQETMIIMGHDENVYVYMQHLSLSSFPISSFKVYFCLFMFLHPILVIIKKRIQKVLDVHLKHKMGGNSRGMTWYDGRQIIFN